ncbi:ImmA/IrrE family metallo-endopeptidase [Agrobacterium rhizogenes]|uniref:ImmA/IrrE family metallo-endopeptidase n=1 Tax=Rhizobium rhizogenes TaxID=359 RepID=UPI00157300C6|nr:ImmA/IrrE family metallo-endopeptidase [Rhizobium rhizogenes]NTF88902.1 ImmA/IrrE family metallo-endopeptidase [Rhizobium rhizogenes]
MRRGFKTQAEKISQSLREKLNLTVRDKIDPKGFLESLGFLVWTPSDVPGIDPSHLAQLTVHDPDSWSGITIREGGATAIVVNSTHPRTRQANTLMHEWAHIELRHKPNRVDRSDAGLLLLSDYPPDFEEEADWLAGAVLMPRDGLVHFRGSGMSIDDIAGQYGVSLELANWRLRMTGVDKQVQARRQYYR